VKEPFRFASEAGVIRWTGYRADDLASFRSALGKVSGSSVYYHFYQSFYRRHFLTVDHMHDFARWIHLNLNVPPLAERLAQVDPTDVSSIAEARARMIAHIDTFLGEVAAWVRIPAVSPFYFLEQDSFVFLTGHEAKDLKEFRECLEKVGEASIYYHLVEARIRLGSADNDFSAWLEGGGEAELAQRIRSINVHRRSIGVTRNRLLEVIGAPRGGKA
jgi:hypothetical protein